MQKEKQHMCVWISTKQIDIRRASKQLQKVFMIRKRWRSYLSSECTKQSYAQATIDTLATKGE